MKRFIFLFAWVSASVYLGLAAVRGTVGFPLDDAWIHQVYARNLGTRLEFAFFAGQPSAGSTSPLWTMLLAIGYALGIDFRAWTYLVGIVLLAASAFIVSRFTFPSSFVFRLSSFIICPSSFLLLEWHLAWSAVSGMEILLFVFLSLLLVERFLARERAWVLGLLAGLLTLTRPEGIVLAALIGLGLLFDYTQHASRITYCVLRTAYCVWRMACYVGTFALVMLPYLAFNWIVSGALLPNTFYAKAAEYAILFERAPFILRWLELLWIPFIGAQVLLVPGLMYIVIKLVMQRNWRALIPFAWIVLLPALYAARLPVAYQHGRYEMPVIPFIIVYGLWGTGALFERIQSWVIRTAWGISIVVTLVIFWVLGATQYATDVAIIDCEMVQTARWVAANAPPNAVIAAHDIGALGYYYPRPFIDLAGLVSPEVIPFIRDEARLREYLSSRQATWVIVFPDWYPSFDADSRFVPVYRTNCAITRAAGERNMVVYQIVR
jgi:hypothetical protein